MLPESPRLCQERLQLQNCTNARAWRMPFTTPFQGYGEGEATSQKLYRTGPRMRAMPSMSVIRHPCSRAFSAGSSPLFALVMHTNMALRVSLSFCMVVLLVPDVSKLMQNHATRLMSNFSSRVFSMNGWMLSLLHWIETATSVPSASLITSSSFKK